MPKRQHMSAGANLATKATESVVLNHGTGARTLGLISELQDYIDALENVAASRKVELDRVRDEKLGVEKMLYHFQQRDSHMRQGELFASLERADMPPRIRAILEDNKMLVDKVRKYKNKCSVAERMIAEQRRHFTRYQDEILKNRTYKKMLRSRSPSMRNQTQRSEGDRQKIAVLEHQVQVLTKKNETDAKQFKYMLSGLRRDNESMQRHTSMLKVTIQEKENEIRFRVIEAKRAQRAHEETKKCLEKKRKSCRPRASTAPLACSPEVKDERTSRCLETQMKGSPPQLRSNAKEVKAEDVCVMLCLIHGDDEEHSAAYTHKHARGASNEGHQDVPTCKIPDIDAGASKPLGLCVEDAAATQIQSHYRGFKTRKELKSYRAKTHQNQSETVGKKELRKKAEAVKSSPRFAAVEGEPVTDDALNRAAIKIQCCTRGMQARKRVERMKVDKAASDVNDQKKVKSTAHHLNWIYRHQQQNMHNRGRRNSGYKAKPAGEV